MKTKNLILQFVSVRSALPPKTGERYIVIVGDEALGGERTIERAFFKGHVVNDNKHPSLWQAGEREINNVVFWAEEPNLYL